MEVKLLRDLPTAVGVGVDVAPSTQIQHEVQMQAIWVVVKSFKSVLFYPANILCLLSSAFLVPFTLQNCLKLQKVRNTFSSYSVPCVCITCLCCILLELYKD